MNSARKQLVNLIKSRQALAKEIKDYNFRYYFVRRANEDIQELENNTSVEVTDEMVAQAEKDVKQMERIKVVQNSIYIV